MIKSLDRITNSLVRVRSQESQGPQKGDMVLGGKENTRNTEQVPRADAAVAGGTVYPTVQPAYGFTPNPSAQALSSVQQAVATEREALAAQLRLRRGGF